VRRNMRLVRTLLNHEGSATVAFDQFNKDQFGGCIHISMAADPSAYRSIADAPLQCTNGRGVPRADAQSVLEKRSSHLEPCRSIVEIVGPRRESTRLLRQSAAAESVSA
jgi:hypothetical protein